MVAWNGTDRIILWMALRGVDIKNWIVYQSSRYGACPMMRMEGGSSRTTIYATEVFLQITISAQTLKELAARPTTGMWDLDAWVYRTAR